MHGGLQLVISHVLESVPQVHDEVVLLGLDRLVLAINENLQAWEAERGQYCDKT